MQKVFRDRFMRHRRPAISVILCFETAPIFRCSRQNGETVRDVVRASPEFIPAYTMEDALGVLQNFVPCPYEKTITPAEGIRVRFVDAGHLLGSASIEVIINEDGKEKKIVFSR